MPAPWFGPAYRSSAAEREAFRNLVPDDVWSGQARTVERMLETAAAAGRQVRVPNPVDVLAVRLYLTPQSGPFPHQALGAALHTGDPRTLPYAACLASGLARMVPYRGPAFRSGDPLPPEQTARGRLLRTSGPVSALTDNLRGPSAATRYAIWSETGRRVHPERARTQTGGTATIPDEVLFAPGTTFRVLGIRELRGTNVILLRDDPSGPIAPGPGAEDQDRAALAALAEALDEDVPAGSRGRGSHWPPRCSGPVGWE
jgi:hypothetical protein